MPAARPLVKLTPEQQQLASDNYGLVYGFCEDFNADVNTYHGLLSEALCKAAQDYIPGQSKFSTFAYKYMKSLYFRELKTQKRAKRDLSHEVFSLNQSCGEKGAETIGDYYMGYEPDFSGVEVQEFMKRLSPREKLCVILWLQGDRTQVTKAIGKGRCTVYHTRLSIKEKVKRYMEG
jgi:DNA-directed RNA polymerase specialized sigma24 family protein